MSRNVVGMLLARGFYTAGSKMTPRTWVRVNMSGSLGPWGQCLGTSDGADMRRRAAGNRELDSINYLRLSKYMWPTYIRPSYKSFLYMTSIIRF